MFKLFILGLFTLVAVVYISIMAKEDPGYALLSYGDWSVEMTLVLLVTGLSSLILVLFFSIYLFLKLLDLPSGFLKWNSERKINSASNHSLKGTIQLVEGNYKSAERHLIKNIESNRMSLLNYLNAAKAAQSQNKLTQRDTYLNLATEHYPEAKLAIALTQAELELDIKQYKPALISLLHLRTLSPNHSKVLLLLSKLYQETESWLELEVLLKDLKRYRVIEAQDLYLLEIQTYQNVLSYTVKNNGVSEMIDYWKNLDRNIKINSDIACFYSEKLIELGQESEAAKPIHEILQREFNLRAIDIYGRVKDTNGAKQLEFAENLLKQYPKNPHLLFTLGKISIMNQLWGKARDYIKESIDLEPDHNKYYFLANLYEQQLDDKELAASCYREGLLLTQESTQLNKKLSKKIDNTSVLGLNNLEIDE